MAFREKRLRSSEERYNGEEMGRVMPGLGKCERGGPSPWLCLEAMRRNWVRLGEGAAGMWLWDLLAERTSEIARK